MNDLIREIFQGTINNEETTWLIKPNSSIENFIESFEYKSTIEEQILIVNQLIKILSSKNSIINISIINKMNEKKVENDKKDKMNFVDWLIKQYFLYRRSEKITKGILYLLNIVINIVGVEKKNLEYIYQKISDYFFYSQKKYFHEEDKINISNDLNYLVRYLNLLLLFYGHNVSENKPYNFYYFGNDGYFKMEPPIKKTNALCLRGGTSIFICFNCIQNPIILDQKYSIIFTIEFNNEIFFSLLIDKEMYLIMCLSNESLSSKDTDDIPNQIVLTQIENNKWYNTIITINIKRNKKFIINTIINSIKYDKIEIENNNPLEKIENIDLFKNFIGLSTSFLLYSTYIENENKNFFNNFQYGLYKISHINKYFDKLINKNDLQNLIILLIPFQIKDDNIYNFANSLNAYLVEDLAPLNNNINIKYILNNDSYNQIFYLSGFNVNSKLNKNILLLGGIENLLPLFEILLGINKKIFDAKNFMYLNIFQKCVLNLLQIIEVIIIKNKKCKIKKVINSKFFKILSLFLEKICVSNDIEGTIFYDKLINILKSIGDILVKSNLVKKEKICKIFFNKILLNINIIKKFNITQHIKISEYIYNYISNDDNINSFIDFNNLIFLIKYYDNIYGINYCCKEHFQYIKEITEVESTLNYNKTLTNLLDLNTKLLSFFIKKDSDEYIDLLNLLIGKQSPCFIELVLKNIFYKNLNNYFKDMNNNNIKKLLINLLKNNFLYILLYLLSIYIYPNIIKEIIELFSIISYLSNIYNIRSQNFFINNNYIINYISNTIYPIHLTFKGDYMTKLNNNANIDYKINHFFSSNLLPYVVNESFDNSLTNINRCNTYDRFQIKTIKLDNNSRKSVKINKSNNKFERKRVIHNTLKYQKRNILKHHNSFSKIKYIEKNNNKKEFNLSFEKQKNNQNGLSMKFVGRYSDKNIITLDEKNDDMYLLNKLNYDRKFIFKRIILDSLINWLNRIPSKYIFEIIIKYLKNIDYEYINLDKFIDSFNQILTSCNIDNNVNLNDLIDVKTFNWFFEITFQFYLLSKNLHLISIIPFEKDKYDLINNIIINGKKAISNIILYNIKNNKYNDLITEINYIMYFSKAIKKKYFLENEIINILNVLYRKILTDLLNICQNHLLLFYKINDESNSEESDTDYYIDEEKENIFIFIINICYEFVFFNNIENNYKEINKFIKSKNYNIFNNILISDLHIITNVENDNNKNNINDNNNIIEEDNFSIKKYISDYSIFEKIILIIQTLTSLNYFNNYEDDKFLNDKILNIKKRNKYINILELLCHDNITCSKKTMKITSLLHILSNLYIFSLNLSKNIKEVKYILDNYKSFIFFLILSSSNLFYYEEENQDIIKTINNIENKITMTINYYIYYIYDKYKKNYEIIEYYLIDVFIIMIRIMNNIYTQNRYKKKIPFFSINQSDRMKDNKNIYKCPVHILFLSEVYVKIFTKEYIASLIKNKFKEFNNINYFIKICSKICIDFNLRQELKNIFNIDNIINKYIDNKNDFNIYSDFSKDNIGHDKIILKINEKIKTLINVLTENNNNYKEKMYIKKLNYKNDYKNIKKILFGFNGFWRNKKIFENNTNNGETLKYKLINHYAKSLFRNILTPIFDLDNYISQYQFINKNTIFKQNKNLNNTYNINIFRKSITNLDFKKLFIEINEDTAQKNNNNDNNIQYYFTEEIRNNIFPDLNYYINKISNDNFYEFNINKSIDKSCLINNSYSCCYIKPDTHIKGYLSLKENKIKFIMDIYNNSEKMDEDYYDKDKGCCYGCIIKYKNNKFFSFKIEYCSIKFIFLRKYYYKESAIEIFTTNNKSYYINFHNPKIRQYIIDIILIHIRSKKEIKTKDNKLLGYYISNDNSNFFISDIDIDIDNNNNSYNLNELIKKWTYWEITTFDFLIYLNIFSNRSFNDLTQYPVFPWILTQYNDFIQPLDKNEKEIQNEIMNNDSENNDVKININQFEAKLNSIMNITSIKSSSEVNSKNNSIIEKDDINNIKKFDIIKDIRDFSIPMGMMSLTGTGEKRKKFYLEKYNIKSSKIKDNPELESENYIYSTHYSNPKYISGYLARIFPFININVELNGRKLINNDNLLISIDKSFKDASSKMDDLRELCPEFFYLPEMFININYFDLKIESNKEYEFKDENLSNNNYNYSSGKSSHFSSELKNMLKEKRLKRKSQYNIKYNINKNTKGLLMNINNEVYYNYDSNDVLIPKWADNNPYSFVPKMKSFLESEEVSKNINQWFDLIFGYKQKGNNGKLSHNLFFPWTYDTFDIKKIKNYKNKKNKFFYIKSVEQGQTPRQLLNYPFPERLPKIVDDFSYSLMKNHLKYNSFKNKKKTNVIEKRRVLKIKFVDDENIICIFNYFQYLLFDIIKYALIVDIKIDYLYKYYFTKEIICKYNYLLINDCQIISLNPPIIIYSKGRYIAQGGFYGGLILLSALDLEMEDKSKNLFSSIINVKEIYNKIDYSPIISLIINNSEDVILAGTYVGSIIIYDIFWNIKNVINDHQCLPITSICFNDELLIWGSTCMDGYIKIYTHPTNKSILSLKVDQSSLYADYLLITSSPLPSFVIYCRKNLYFYSYSLIGKLIEKDKEEYIDIKSPIIIRDNYGNDKLLYGDDTGSINIRFLPDLELLQPFEINESSINIINISDNRKYCAGWSDEEEEIYIIFDPNLIE